MGNNYWKLMWHLTDNPAAVIKAKSLKRSCSEMSEEVKSQKKKLDGVIQELEEKKRKMK